MKKLILSTALASGLFAGNIVSNIIGNFVNNQIDQQMQNVTGGDIFNMCYQKQQQHFTIDVCGMLPNISNIGLDVCGMLPNIPGYVKKSSNLGLDSLIGNNYCNDVANQANNVIGDLDIYSSEDGKTNYPSGTSTDYFYDDSNGAGNVKNILSKTSMIKDNFLNNNQGVVRETLNYAKLKNISDITKVKATDLKAPATYKKYLEQREGLAKITISDIVANTPLNVSSNVQAKIQDKQGASAKNATEQYIEKATDTIKANTSKRVGFEIALQRKKTDFAIPTEETLSLYTDEVRPQKLLLMKKQIRREAKIKADIILEDKLRSDIVALVAEKTLILNERFDRDEAEKSIEDLLKN